MKISAPINSPDEVDMLAACGAGEFYCGVVPEDWIDRYSYAVWLNRREVGKANLTSIANLRLLVDRSHNHSIPVFLTLNAPYYTGNQMPYILEMVEVLYSIGVDGLIISDVGLILALMNAEIDIDIRVSSVAAVRNHEAAEFFKSIGIKKIILPRHLNLLEIREIKKKVEGIEYEVFILNDGCVYEEGFCSTTHSVGSFCMTEWNYEFYGINGNELDQNDRERLNSNLRDYQKWIWYVNNCGCTFSENGFPNGPCGLCAVYDLYHIGIGSLKVVGREATSYRKLRGLQMVRSVLEKVEQGFSKEDICKFAISMRGTKEFCDSGYMCYYREAKSHAQEDTVY